MDEKKKGYSIEQKPVLWVSIFGLIIGVLVIALIMALSNSKSSKEVEITDTTDEPVQETSTNEPEEEVIVIDHPIVGKWQFYKDVNYLLNSEWILVFNEDGTYYTDSSEPNKEDSERGFIAKKRLYSYGTYSVDTSRAKDELIYFHEGHQKTLNRGFVIEEVEGVEQLTFYRGTSKISSTHNDGENIYKIYETFIRMTEGN